MHATEMVMGGHARTGLEDNIYYSYRVLAEARELLGLSPAPAASPGSGQ